MCASISYCVFCLMTMYEGVCCTCKMDTWGCPPTCPQRQCERFRVRVRVSASFCACVCALPCVCV